MPALILASASPRRKDLLARIGVVADAIVPADIDETPHKDELPLAYVKRVAASKARAVGTQHPNDIVLAADTTVACGRRILGKPEDAEQARAFLRLLSGRRHHVMTAVAVYANGVLQQKCVDTVVKFRRLSAADIEAYVATGEWEGKAGAYGIQGAAETFIPWIRGSHSAVVGLPLNETQQLLRSVMR